MSATPDWKPSARERATRNEWEHLRATKLAGACRGCGDAGEHLHHLLPRAQGGADVAANLVPLCQLCHQTWHSHSRAWAIVAVNIRHSLSDEEAAYVRVTKGGWWLDRFYPLTTSSGEQLCAKCKRPRKPKPAALEPRRPRKRWQIRVPADAEDGADVLDALVDQARERLQDQLGLSETVDAYYVLVPVLASFLHDERRAA